MLNRLAKSSIIEFPIKKWRGFRESMKEKKQYLRMQGVSSKTCNSAKLNTVVVGFITLIINNVVMGFRRGYKIKVTTY